MLVALTVIKSDAAVCQVYRLCSRDTSAAHDSQEVYDLGLAVADCLPLSNLNRSSVTSQLADNRSF